MVSSDDEISVLMNKKMKDLQRKFNALIELKKINKPIILSDSNFDIEKSKYPLLLVDFWASWCGPCKVVLPIIEQLAQEYTGKVVFAKINVDENPILSKKFGIQSIPTMILFKYGEVIDIIIGALPRGQIESKLRNYLEK
ncbi:MAG: thioredoxin [Nitrososphaeraceae archaeon]|nr:thioredoxin [Nitrososphaeraceae archaeon]